MSGDSSDGARSIKAKAWRAANPKKAAAMDELLRTAREQETPLQRGRRLAYEAFMTPTRERALSDHIDEFIDRWMEVSDRQRVGRYVTADQEERRAIGRYLRDTRKRCGMARQSDLATAADVGTETISRLENGANVEVDTLARVWRVLFQETDSPGQALFEQDPDWFRDRLDYYVQHPEGEASRGNVDVLDDPIAYRRESIPVLYECEAGAEGLAWSPDDTPLFEVTEWGSRPSDIKDGRAYLVVVRGDSMEPLIKRGYRAIVSPNLQITDADLACVHLKTGERLIKSAHRDRAQQGWQLVSFNTAYPPRFVRDDDVLMIHKVAYVRTMK